jgi:hypothetical protein
MLSSLVVRLVNTNFWIAHRKRAQDLVRPPLTRMDAKNHRRHFRTTTPRLARGSAQGLVTGPDTPRPLTGSVFPPLSTVTGTDFPQSQRCIGPTLRRVSKVQPRCHALVPRDSCHLHRPELVLRTTTPMRPRTSTRARLSASTAQTPVKTFTARLHRPGLSVHQTAVTFPVHQVIIPSPTSTT